jgi:hypothetical protein
VAIVALSCPSAASFSLCTRRARAASIASIWVRMIELCSRSRRRPSITRPKRKPSSASELPNVAPTSQLTSRPFIAKLMPSKRMKSVSQVATSRPTAVPTQRALVTYQGAVGSMERAGGSMETVVGEVVLMAVRGVATRGPDVDCPAVEPASQRVAGAVAGLQRRRCGRAAASGAMRPIPPSSRPPTLGTPLGMLPRETRRHDGAGQRKEQRS